MCVRMHACVCVCVCMCVFLHLHECGVKGDYDDQPMER